MSTLQQIADDLAYAAHTGARQVARDVTASARMHAEIGVAVRVPGPALRSVLPASKTTVADATAAALPEVAQRAATQAADEGVDIALGRRR